MAQEIFTFLNRMTLYPLTTRKTNPMTAYPPLKSTDASGPPPRRWGALLTLLGFTMFLIAGSILLGPVAIPPLDVLSILAGHEGENDIWRPLIWEIRLPRTLAAVIAGAALAFSGLQLQAMFRNPLAGPYVLGIDAGASLGVALVTLAMGLGRETFLSSLGWQNDLSRMGAGALGAAITMAVVFLFALRLRNDVTLLVVGLLVGYFVSGMVGILIYISSPESVTRYLQWTFGSFAEVTWPALQMLTVGVGAGIAIGAVTIKPLDALLVGDEFARSVGIRVSIVRMTLIASASLLAGAVTAVCGPIGFIGVAVPHAARWLLRTQRHLLLFPAVLMLGAIFSLTADIIARGPFQTSVLPINAVTALFGAPILIALVWRRRGMMT